VVVDQQRRHVGEERRGTRTEIGDDQRGGGRGDQTPAHRRVPGILATPGDERGDARVAAPLQPALEDRAAGEAIGVAVAEDSQRRGAVETAKETLECGDRCRHRRGDRGGRGGFLRCR